MGRDCVGGASAEADRGEGEGAMGSTLHQWRIRGMAEAHIKLSAADTNPHYCEGTVDQTMQQPGI